ncbi:SMP-30/gluconolactonase/LRE family protein [Telmatospirillum sp.]|uniref:SMP-30/gluconolactonase/LRE family protein n=1 Tax=Telmatospirillum sp. TaxID=2079197 RepID=UPI00284B7AF8|nr:SMP-30/gluconolactonase/LRE family protein [Telmatospirillum sp.]MDR3438072.1 SMP-30/gluconolactonase/LRE family protein [Telmatospirillum sp.]
MTFSCLLDVKAELGECPLWSVREQALYWIDIKGQAIHRFDPDTGETAQWPVPEQIGCLALAASGGFVAGMRSGLWRIGADGQMLRKLADNPENWTTSRFNDGRCDRLGRLWAGTLDEPKAGRNAHLYRFDERGLVAVGGGLLTSNGLAFSPDNHWLYHSDTPAFTVYRYAFDLTSGEIGPRQPWIELPSSATERGRPDGAAVDAAGRYWTALYEGGRIQCYNQDGHLVGEYPLPVRCPTMVAFGGPDLKTLFVTSARAGRPAGELAAHPSSGSLFAMPVDIPGQAEPEFAD